MRIVFIFVLILSVFSAKAQEGITWMTLDEAEKQYKENPKPLLIDFYTDWCGWCKRMDATTYSNPVVVSFINRFFYPVKINAETNDTLTFKGKVYPPVKNGSKTVSSFAVEMLGGRLGYPTTIFLYEQENINIVVPGYIDIPKMQGFLVFFAENAYKTTNINVFLEDFQQIFASDSQIQGDTLKNYWTSFDELEEKRKAQPKKILLFLHADWNNSSQMMERIIFQDSVFSEILQNHFYNLQLDARSDDSIVFMTHRFGNAGEADNNLHQLAIALSDKVLRVPAVYIFNEDGHLMERLYFYLDRSRGKMIVDYIGNNIYKDMSWDDYVKMKSKENL